VREGGFVLAFPSNRQLKPSICSKVAPAHMSFAGLSSVWGGITSHAIGLVTPHALTRVRGNFQFHFNVNAPEMSAPALRSVGGDFKVWFNITVQNVEASKLATVGGGVVIFYGSQEM